MLKYKNTLLLISNIVLSVFLAFFLSKKITNSSFENYTSDVALRELLTKNYNQQQNEINGLKEKLVTMENYLDAQNKRAFKIKQIKKAVQQTLRDNRYKYSIDYIVLDSYSNAVLKWSDEYNVSIPLILAMTRQESGFKPDAVSAVGAIGMMQVMPYTAQQIAKEIKVSRYDLNKVNDNVRFGVFYIMKMLDFFAGDVELAVKAYNCGPTCISRVQNNEQRLPNETFEYAKRILSDCLQEHEDVCLIKGFVKYYEDMGL